MDAIAAPTSSDCIGVLPRIGVRGVCSGQAVGEASEKQPVKRC